MKKRRKNKVFLCYFKFAALLKDTDNISMK